MIDITFIIVVSSFTAGMCFGVTWESLLSRWWYSKTQVSAYLLDMASYVATKELRDDFENNYNSWYKKSHSLKII